VRWPPEGLAKCGGTLSADSCVVQVSVSIVIHSGIALLWPEAVVKIGIVQPVVHDWDWGRRSEYASELIMRLKHQRPDIICLPELFPGRVEQMQACAREIGAYIICGEMRKRRKLLRTSYLNNAALLAPNGEVLGRHSKVLLMPGEEAFGYKHGTSHALFDIPFGKIAILICAEFPLAPESTSALAMSGADIIFVPAMAVKPLMPYWKLFLVTRSMDNGVPVVFVNIGEQFLDDGTVYGGGQSSVVIPMPPQILSLGDFYSAENIKPDDHVQFAMDGEERVEVVDVDVEVHKGYRREILELRRRALSAKLTSVDCN